MHTQKQQLFLVLEHEVSTRLDIFLSEKLSCSRAQAKKYIDTGWVQINKKQPKKAGDIVKIGDQIVFQEQEKNTTDVLVASSQQEETYNKEIKIIADADDYVVVYKPAGLLTHETQAHEADTLASRVLRLYPTIQSVGDSIERPGIVHRLDKDASGLLVIAKTQKSFLHLKQQFQDRQIEKYYDVLVYGLMDQDHGLIDFDIDRGTDGRMVSRPKTDVLKLKNVTKIQPGKKALTEYWLEQAFVRMSLLKVRIHSGRTHQIRVHMFAMGHPVVGDLLYKNKKIIKKSERKLNRLFLHARELSFIDMHGERVNYHCDLPEELANYLNMLVI